MVLQTGNFWLEIGKSDLMLIPLTNYFDKNKVVPMGDGYPWQARQRFPELPGQLGKAISRALTSASSEDYGIVSVVAESAPPDDVRVRVGAFQCRRSFGQPASLDLIEFSAAKLLAKCHKFARIVMPLPGSDRIGRLDPKLVAAKLSCLPDNVVIYVTETELQGITQ